MNVTNNEHEEDLVVNQQMLPFEGDALLVALTAHGVCYVSLGDMCGALGLDTRGQQQRIKRAPALLEGFRHLSLRTGGGRQTLSCLRAEKIELWLASIRTKQATNLFADKIDRYRKALPGVVLALFSLPAQLVASPREQVVLNVEGHDRTQIVDALPIDPETDSLQQEMLMILANLPSTDTMTHVTTTSSEVDRSLREGILAPEERWQVVSDTRIFSASTDLEVYLGSPTAPLALDEAQAKITAMGGSAIITARVALGLWNVRRYNSRLSINGSAAIRLDEILAWRGVQPHHRPSSPEGERLHVDGYRVEHKEQILRDLEILATCCIRGNCIVTVNGRRETLYVNGPYLRYSIVSKKNERKAQDVLGFFVAPGDWIMTYPAQGSDILAIINRRVFELNPQNEQHELRLALYLVEQWRQQATQHRYDTPYSMQDLLVASMITIDADHFERFASRIEHALIVLWERGILGEQPVCFTPVDKAKGRWKQEWLAALWRIVPPRTLVERYMPLAVERRRIPRKRRGV